MYGRTPLISLLSGTTEIGHDRESPEEVESCQSESCFQFNVTYPNVTLTQIQALIDTSEKCYQSIQVRF